MSNLSELLPAGGAAKEFEVVASGSLGNGATVILNSDGTVSIAGITTGQTVIPEGSSATFNSGSSNQISASFDPNNSGKFIVAYRDSGNSSYGTACVGTVSGTSISFGSEYVFNSANTYYISVSVDPLNSGKFVVAYADGGNGVYGTAIIGTVSGTSISFGSEYVFNATNSNYIVVSFDPINSGKFVASYTDVGNSSYGTSIVGTVSGTSISYGSEAALNSSSSSVFSISFDPNTTGKFVVAYKDVGNSNYGAAIVGTVSGTSISYGTAVVFNSGSTANISVDFDPNTANKFVVSYRDNAASGVGKSIVGTVSGTSISFGTAVVFNTEQSDYISSSFDPSTAGKFIVAYRDYSNSQYGTAVVGTISGTSVSFSSEYIFDSSATDYIVVNFDPNTAGKFVLVYSDDNNGGAGKAILGNIDGSATNLTSTNFAGTSTAAFTNGQTATIVPQGGVSTNQSSLTIGSTYYVQPAGTLATSAGDPSVVAGKAISATSLILKGNS